MICAQWHCLCLQASLITAIATVDWFAQQNFTNRTNTLTSEPPVIKYSISINTLILHEEKVIIKITKKTSIILDHTEIWLKWLYIYLEMARLSFYYKIIVTAKILYHKVLSRRIQLFSIKYFPRLSFQSNNHDWKFSYGNSEGSS